MKESLERIRSYIADVQKIDGPELQKLLSDFLKNYVKGLHVENYIGDYPTFMEPIHLGNKVKIGDDVLIGPNVFIGDNSEIGDYGELSNTIIFENVKLGSNVKLENCIVVKDGLITDNLNEKNCILLGPTNSNIDKIPF